MAEEQIPGEPATRSAIDEVKRRIILTVLASGNSRRAAAKLAGCAPSTINRTVAHDPKFADQVAAAELSAEVELVRRVRNASQDPRYWRSAAWFLERRNPDEFGPRAPWTFTQREVAELLVQVMDVTFEGLSDEKVDEALARLGELVQGIQDTRAGFPPRRDAPAGGPPLAPSPVPALPVPLDPDEHGLWDTPAEGSGQ